MEDYVLTAVIGVLGAFVGGLFGFLAAYISTRSQYRLAKINNEHQLKMDGEKAARIFRQKELIRLREQIERSHIICSFIALENSQTVSFVESMGDLNIDAFNQRYFNNCEKINELRAIAAIDIPELSKITEEIFGLANVFWGNQSWTMEHLKNKNPDGADAVSQGLYKAIHTMPEKINEAKYILRQRSIALNKLLSSDTAKSSC